MSVFTLMYHPDRWQQRGSQLYQKVWLFLDPQRLLLAEVIYEPEAEKTYVGHAGVYTLHANASEESWHLVYAIPPVAITVIAAPV